MLFDFKCIDEIVSNDLCRSSFDLMPLNKMNELTILKQGDRG